MANDMANYSNHDSDHDSDTDSDAAPRPSYLDSPLAVDDPYHDIPYHDIPHDVDPRVEWDDEINVQINQGRMQPRLKKIYERDRDEGCYFYVNKYAKSNDQSNEQSNDDNDHVYNYNHTANIWMDFDNNTDTNDTNNTTQIGEKLSRRKSPRRQNPSHAILTSIRSISSFMLPRFARRSFRNSDASPPLDILPQSRSLQLLRHYLPDKLRLAVR